MKRKIHLIIIMAFAFIISLGYVNAVSLDKVNNATLLSSEYSWSPKFISGVTQAVPFGNTDYSDDNYSTNNSNPDNAYSVRITSNNQKGNIGIRYNNVGTYNGNIIDLKITVVDWSYVQPANSSAKNYPTIFFHKNNIDIHISSTPAIDKPVYRYTFYKHGTEEQISVKGHFTFCDMDGNNGGHANEFLVPQAGFVAYYITGDSYLTVDGDRIANNTDGETSNDNKRAWTTVTFSGPYMQFAYSRLRDERGNPYRNVTAQAGSSRTFYHYMVVSAAVGPFEYVSPTKSVSVSSITGTDSFYYSINHFVPGEDKEFHYTAYTLKDEIPSCFNINSISVKDDSGSDRTSWFNISTSNNIITITSKVLNNDNFYNNNYTFRINVSKKENYNMSKWYDGTTCTIPNSANVTISSPTISSTRSSTLYTNTVNVVCNFNITTYIDHGIITPNKNNVSAGSD